MSLVGKWEFVSADNLDQYMESTGVPEALREVARNSKPSMDIVQSGDSWSIKTTVGETVKDTTFKIGEEFESKSLTGQNLKCIVTMEGDKMTEVQTAGDVKVVITREVAGNELVSKMAFGSVVAVVKFAKA
ncbi:fatty acid-binding protein, brain-like [Mizuhopecten yessoensis]|uniref:Fatty acid-binding protein, brain n=1 Tax=Mizuhopecten yessoensis TaxID=6573 RepID=A0A210QCW4_MIZYE|nr:fatty acid-binding protein, brain-like [Mizuhopecten yessoensis]OWF46552.1 Fatty acid-binding protein, brain [Mizuhopecten yessoensis]